MTQHFNDVAALSKVITSPLDRLSDAMLDSIAGSHARRGTPAFAGLHEKLIVARDERRVREGAA